MNTTRTTISLAIVATALLGSPSALADDATPPATPSTGPSTTTAGATTSTAAGAPVQPQTSTTTTTGADVGDQTVTPVPTVPVAGAARSEDTVTLYQSVRPNKPLLYTGGILLLGAYVPTATLTAVNNQDPGADKALYLPVVGPWMNLADRHSDSSSDNTRDTILIAASGVVQGVGAGLLIASLVIPEKVPAATVQAGNTKIHFAPTSFGVASAGVGAGGTF